MSANSGEQLQIKQTVKECDPAAKQLILSRARLAEAKSKNEEVRRELLGVHYKGPLQEQAQIQGQLQPMAGNAAILEEGQTALEKKLDLVLAMLQPMSETTAATAEGVNDLQASAVTIETGLSGVSTQISKFQEGAMAALGSLADNGVSSQSACRRAYKRLHATDIIECLSSIIMLFLMLFLTFSRLYWTGTRAVVGTTRAIVSSIPIVGGALGSICGLMMSLAMLWVTTLVVTMTSFGVVDGKRTLGIMIEIIRFVLKEVVTKILEKSGQMTTDLTDILQSNELRQGSVASDAAFFTSFAERSKENVGTWLVNASSEGMSSAVAATLGTPSDYIPDSTTPYAIVSSMASGVSTGYSWLKWPAMRGTPAGGKKRAGRGGTTQMTTKQQEQIDEINTLLKVTGHVMLILLETYFKTLWMYNNVSDVGKEKMDALIKKNGYFSELGQSDNKFMRFLLKTNKDVMTSIGKCKQDPTSTYDKKSLVAYFSNVMASPMLRSSSKGSRSLEGGRKRRKTRKMSKKRRKMRKTSKRKRYGKRR